MSRIKKSHLTIKPSKCKFPQDHVLYLGHIVGQGIRRPSDTKIKAIINFPVPKNKTDIRTFLGLSGYYSSRYIPNYSIIAAFLTDALKGRLKRGEVLWTEWCQKSFDKLKDKLVKQPVLYSPSFNKEFILQTDASNTGIGVVLTQINKDGEEHPILYLSKKFTESEKRYGTTEKECARIIFAVKKLHYYLAGNHFTIQADHNPLVGLQKNSSTNPRLMCWT